VIAPLEIGENPVAWLARAAVQGQPAVVPVTFHGHAAVASTVCVWADPRLNTARRHPDHRVREVLAIDACIRAHAHARTVGATPR
jgi:hypothetical protein